ncbi:MAG: FixH family protein [Bacteroidetes bacterium]|nr:FixH family protein [Bacteroidota bacterium]MDA1119137.1 FixH family protein [Bacteroidota bacterium]
MNWGHKIILAFIFFGVFIITLVAVCVNEDFDLVSEDYYQQEIDFESRIEDVRNSNNLEKQPSMVFNANKRRFEIVFPEDIRGTVADGDIVFYRPSNSNFDFKQPLRLDGLGRQLIDLEGKEKGLWEVELSWFDGQKSFYIKTNLFI